VSLHQAAAATAASHVSSSREDTPSGSASEGTRGHARDPLEEEHLFLNIGPSTFSGLVKAEHDYPPSSSSPIPIPAPSTTSISEHTITTTVTNSSSTATSTATEIETTTTVPDDFPIVSESPGASEIDIYETAYREEIERIKHRSISRRDTSTIYLTRRVEDKKYHLDEVMKLLQHPSSTTQNPKPSVGVTQGEEASPSSDEVILRLGGKVPSAVASAQAVFKSALTTQIEARAGGGGSSGKSGSTGDKQDSV
jgi:[calcium/calmodulin-dependent protein kinase] kinase